MHYVREERDHFKAIQALIYAPDDVRDFIRRTLTEFRQDHVVGAPISDIVRFLGDDETRVRQLVADVEYCGLGFRSAFDWVVFTPEVQDLFDAGQVQQ